MTDAATIEVSLPSLFETLKRCYDDPLLFVTDVLRAQPEPWQEQALKAVARHDRVSIRSSHGVGKTALKSWLVLWFLSPRRRCKVESKQDMRRRGLRSLDLADAFLLTFAVEAQG